MCISVELSVLFLRAGEFLKCLEYSLSGNQKEKE